MASIGTLPDGTKAGVLRWEVKTLQDDMASQVAFDSPVDIGLDVIAGWQNPLPHPLPKQFPRGAGPEEFRVYRVTGMALKIKLEGDGDYHIVIEDASGVQLDLECVQPQFAENSIKLPVLTEVRQATERLFGASPHKDRSYRMLDLMEVTITGVGFWDEEHGQAGIGNGFELHPILSIAPTGNAPRLRRSAQHR